MIYIKPLTMLCHFIIIKLRSIISDQNSGEPKMTYDILSKTIKHFVGSNIY
jgi:hypothetical protein